MFQSIYKVFLSIYTSGWNYRAVTKHKSKQRTVKGESAPKKAKRVLCAGKVMTSVFWNVHGLIFTDYLQKSRTVNGEHCANLLNRFSIEIKRTWPQNNAPAHTSVLAMVKINEPKFELFSHSCYSPDLAWSEFLYFLFLNMKKWLGGQTVINSERVIAAVNGRFVEFDKCYLRLSYRSSLGKGRVFEK